MPEAIIVIVAAILWPLLVTMAVELFSSKSKKKGGNK